MAKKADLLDWVQDALRDFGGKSEIVPICRHIWTAHSEDIEHSGDLFYTWQYDMRWAATTLRKQGKMIEADTSPRGVWELT